MSFFAFDDDACARIALDGTPAFAYSTSVAATQFLRLRKALPARVRLAYAMKANPHPTLVKLFADLGASIDCASGGELTLAQAFAPGRLLYAGPGKRTEELSLALRLGVRVQAEGWEDLERLDRLASDPVAVNLRVHPKGGIQEGSPLIGGTGPSAFGVDEEDVPRLLERAANLRHVAIRGLHVFAASNELNANRLLATHRHVLGMARSFQVALGVPLEQLDLGGGLGVPYTDRDAPLDAETLGRGLGELLEANPWFQGELILEPGRYLAASCGVYLTRVTRVKESRGVRFAILEGGVNHLLRPLLTGQPFPTKALSSGGPLHPTTLAGPLCTSLDRLGEVDLPRLEPGTLLAMGMTGAYGFTEAMAPFLSHPVPREVWES